MVILIDFILKRDEKFCLQTVLKEFEYRKIKQTFKRKQLAKKQQTFNLETTLQATSSSLYFSSAFRALSFDNGVIPFSPLLLTFFLCFKPILELF